MKMQCKLIKVLTLMFMLYFDFPFKRNIYIKLQVKTTGHVQVFKQNYSSAFGFCALTILSISFKKLFIPCMYCSMVVDNILRVSLCLLVASCLSSVLFLSASALSSNLLYANSFFSCSLFLSFASMDEVMV